MTSFLLKKSFHQNLCQSLVDDVQFQRSNYYYFLGRIAKWSADSDQVPVDIYDNSGSENSTRAEIISIKKVLPSDISAVTRRIDWRYGKVFDQYDSTVDLTNKDFYAITDTFDVYKCRDNGDGGQSLVKPSGTSLVPFRTLDNYLWKYMYTVTQYKRNKFMSEFKIPVQRAITDRFYNLGAIDGAVITNAGTGYELNPVTSLEVVGGVSGSGAIIETVVAGGSGSILGITVIDQGDNYTHGCRINLNTVNGSGAELRPVIVNNKLVGVTVVKGGIGYIQGTVAIVEVGGAVVVPVINSLGSIISATITDAGIGYATAPSIVVVSSVGTGKFTENSTAVLSAIVSGGSLVNVAVMDPGIDYGNQTSPTISIIGDGTGAKLVPVVNYNGSVIGTIVESKGSGYTYAQGQIYGTGSNAELKILLSESDFISDQSSVEQTAIDGALYNIVVVNTGSDYQQANITIIGDGNDAQAVAVLDQGKLVGISITNAGKGYTTARIVITGDNMINNPLAAAAAAYAIISPAGGHGHDAVRELYSDSVCIFSDIRNENPNSFNQDFREYGVIKDIRDLYTGNVINKISGSCTYVVTVDTVVGLLVDELLYAGSATYRVVSINPDTLEVVLSATSKNQLAGLTVLTAVDNSSRQHSVLSIRRAPDANKYSGQMLFVSNSDAFTFSDEQEINIKTFLTL